MGPRRRQPSPICLQNFSLTTDTPTTPLTQETRTYWFNPSTLEAETEFMLVGLVLGLAIYNSVLLDFPLPIALYKKLVGQPPSLRDLSDMEPTVGKSLRELLNYGGARSHVCCSFECVL